MTEPKAGAEPHPVQGASYFTAKRFRNAFRQTKLASANIDVYGSKQSADEWCARFQNVWRPISPHTGRSNGQVRVAVLDTGVDEAVLEKYGENIRGKKNFLYEADRDQGEKSDDSDADDSDDADPDILDQDANRHGSHVVELILKLVPCVDIYVARIAKDCASNMDPACIAKAIEYASEQWDVHIISMSWGFENRHEVIERAIELASKREKIMFAAASNLGANGPRGFRVTFPASRPDVICINSADGHGKYSSFNPGKRKGSFNFLTLGEAVPAAKHAKDRSQPEVRLTGTSYATPIAAAIAASFIEFVMQKPLGRERKLRDEVTTRDGMIKLFAGMSEDKTEGFRWLQPWHLIRCDEHSDSHNCKSCRKESAQRVRKLLEGPLPLPDDRVLLPDLPHVPEAEVESQLSEERSDCIHGTRVELLQQIQAWIDDKGGSPIWWLTGNTGTGKSTVARTVARNLRSEKRLAASFFFSRNHESCSSASRLVTSIAHQLAKYSPRAASAIEAAIAKDHDLAKLSKGRSVQWEKLVLEPLSFIETSAGAVVMVIDALDECEQLSDMQYFLQVLGSRKLPGSTLRILLTSRPEKEIEESLKAQTFCSEVYRFDLGEIPRSIVDHDISNLVTVHMEQLKAECSGRGLPMNFVDDKVIESLTRKSDGLFIYAEVACRYIRKGNDLLEVRNQPRQLSTTPKQRLESVLTDRRFQGLDALYSEILEQAVQGDDEALLATQLREVLELLVGLLEPIPEGALSKLCLSGLDPFLLSCRLDSLQSVLIGRSQRVQIFHESFRTFLVEKAGPRFLIQEKVAHMNLFRASLFVMTVAQGGVLKRDMCGLAHPGFSTRKIDDRVEVDDFIPPETRYACQYWVDHLDSLGPTTRVSTDLSDDGEVHKFLQKHFLHWLEVLSLTKNLPKSLAMIRNLEEHVKSAVTSAVSSDLLHIVMDAVNFIRRNMYIAKKMPLQLYGSALIFSPGDSKIREMFSHEIWPIIRHCSKPEGPWNTHFRTLQGHENRVTSLSISSDGKWLATTCSNQLLIWNAKTELLEETFNWRCDTVLFSPKGQHLATSDKLILSIWGNATKSEREDLRNGNPQMKLKHKIWTGDLDSLQVRSGNGGSDYRRIFSAAFSPNGQWIASATCSWDICLWDVNSGQLVWSEIGIGAGPQLSPCMAAVAFSPDGRLFGVDRALEDVSIYAVDASQPQPITYRGSLSGFTCGSGTVFRPDNTSMAVPECGIAILDFKEHRYKGRCGSGTVVTLAFSPDGRFFATQTRTGDVMIWRVTGVPAIQDPYFEASTRFLVFSPNGQQLYSGGIDHVVRVWDVSNAFEKLLNTPNPSRRGEQPAVVLKRDGTQTYQASKAEENLNTRSLCLSRDGKRLVSATEVSLKIWDTATGFLERECRGGHTFVILSPDDRWLVSAGSDSSILIWDAQTWTIRHRIRYDWETLSAHPRVSKRFLLLASTNRKLELWSLETGGVYKALTIPEEADGEVQTDHRFVDSAAISHDERWIACVYGSHVALVWDTKTGEVAGDFVASEGILCEGVENVWFSSDDSAIGVNDDGDLMEFSKIKDAATGKPKWVYSHRLDLEELTRGWRKWEPKGPHYEVRQQPSEGNDCWITLNGENVIWVPPEFANTQCAPLMQRNQVALGLSRGGVYCITFDAESVLDKLSR